MYSHVLINTVDGNSYDFYDVKELNFNETLRAYQLLSQNGNYHFFPELNVESLVV